MRRKDWFATLATNMKSTPAKQKSEFCCQHKYLGRAWALKFAIENMSVRRKWTSSKSHPSRGRKKNLPSTCSEGDGGPWGRGAVQMRLHPSRQRRLCYLRNEAGPWAAGARPRPGPQSRPPGRPSSFDSTSRGGVFYWTRPEPAGATRRPPGSTGEPDRNTGTRPLVTNRLGPHPAALRFSPLRLWA